MSVAAELRTRQREREPGAPGTSRDAIHHHYDTPGTEFFALWLDPTLTYSGALWEDAQTLEQAQLRKQDYFIEGVGAPGCARVLDIGCGWGGAMRRMVDHHRVGHVTGLTLSESQASHIVGWCDPRCEVRLESWSDHQAADAYDAIISVGAMEHFAKLGLDRAAKIQAYRAFFRRCFELLPRGGRLGIQTITEGNVRLDRQALADTRFIYSTIFPETVVPRLAEIVQATEKLFEIVALRNDGEHYARTCAPWLERLRANHAAAVAVAGREMTDNYTRYVEACLRHFERGQATLMRAILVRV